MAFSPYIQMLVNDGAREIWVLDGQYISGTIHVLSATLTATNSGTIRVDDPLAEGPWTLDESLQMSGSTFLGYQRLTLWNTGSVPTVVSMTYDRDWTIEWWMIPEQSSIPWSTKYEQTYQYGKRMFVAGSLMTFLFSQDATGGIIPNRYRQWTWPFTYYPLVWEHMTLVFSAGSGWTSTTASFYRNGVIQPTASFTQNDPSLSPVLDPVVPLSLGCDKFSSNTIRNEQKYFMFTVYQSALSASTILSHSRLERWYPSGSIRENIPESYSASDVFTVVNDARPAGAGQTDGTSLQLSQERVGGNNRQNSRVGPGVN